MIKIACSTGIRSTAPLDVACGVIAKMGFRYRDACLFPAAVI